MFLFEIKSNMIISKKKCVCFKNIRLKLSISLF